MPQRIRLSRRAGWRKPEGAVVVTRPGRWGNPFPKARWGLDRSVRLLRDAARGTWDPTVLPGEPPEALTQARAAAEAWRARLGGDPMARIRTELAGRDLACWCALDAACHADVLLELANAPEGSPAEDVTECRSSGSRARG